ncbi:WD40 repeat-like protein [Gigaspora margarita]|uniref:WD40 repeat-like protein n=1 Tax=Gigaspora margarita TaxID=4874 RepID=A0A8H4EF46_GIGMA|nr:WD40 repeat-like protein [Gigaspora margarita]
MRTFKCFSDKVGFPVYCAGFDHADKVIIGGGGGVEKTGIKNKLELYKVNEKILKSSETLEKDKKILEKLSEIEFEDGNDSPQCITFHSEENIISCGINSSIEKIKTGENQNCRIFSYSDERIELIKTAQTIGANIDEDYYQKATAFSHNGKLLATGGTDSKLTVLKYPSLDVAFPPVNFNKQEIYDIDFNSTGDQIVAASEKILRILSTRNGECIQSIERPTFQKSAQCKFRACRFGKGSSEGYLFTVVNSTSKFRSFIVKWDAKTWNKVLSKAISRKPITAFAVSNDGNLLAFGNSDQSVSICDARTFRIRLTVPHIHELPVTTLGFNTDSTLVISGSADHSVHIMQLPEKFDSGIANKTWLFVIIVALLFAFLYPMYLLGE